MPDRNNAQAGPGEPVEVRVRTRRLLDAMRNALGMRPKQKTAPDKTTRKSPRIAVQMPFSYRVIRNDRVMPDTFQGTIFNIGYHGMLADLNQPLPDHSEIKLKLDTLLSGPRPEDIDAAAAEIYARIIDTRPVNGWDVSGIEFTSLSPQSEKLLMHFMLHTVHPGNTVLDEYLLQHERDVTKKTDAWQITKRIILAILLAASAAFFYLVWLINESLSMLH